jgi:hypothetical protein
MGVAAQLVGLASAAVPDWQAEYVNTLVLEL